MTVYSESLIKVKVLGSKKGLERFIKVLDAVFPLNIKSAIMPSDRDPGKFHVFIDLNLDSLSIKEAAS